MNKKDFVKAVAAKAEITQVEADKVVSIVLETITDQLAEGNDVTFTGFGTFLVRERAERVGRNPRSGEKITIPAQKTPAFKAGKSLKDRIK